MKSKNKFISSVLVMLFLFAFVDISNLDRDLYKILCHSLDTIFVTNCTDFYDIPFWLTLSSFGTIVALAAAWFAIRQSNRQLEIEQTPHIILDHIRRIDNRYGFAVKNVGRGPAIHITFSRESDATLRNEAFFSHDQNHSANFYPSEESHYWMVDGDAIDGLDHDEAGFAHLYIFFEGQSGNLYMTAVKIKRIEDRNNDAGYVVMENKFFELKQKPNITA